MKRKVKRYDSGGGVLRDSSGNPVLSGSGEPVRTRYGSDSSDKEDKYDLESVKKPRSIEEQIGRKAESKEEEPRRKISDYMKSSGPFSNVEAAVKSATSRDTESSAPAPVKKAMKVAEKAAPAPKKEEAEPKKPRPLAFKEAEPKFVKEGEKLGSQGSFKFDSTPKKAPVTRYRKQEEAAPEVKVPKSKMDYEPEEPKLPKDDSRYKTKYGEFSFQKGFKKDEEKPEKKIRSAADIRAGRYKSGGSVSSASKRADGIAQRGKTRGRIC